ncbi:MAG: hypothetical protein CL916_10460 [Deltaproteobacteria bacterium]|nr:hypothetical protein [Deltaproteobacteria bacterium]
MELEQLLLRFLHQECTHGDILDVVVPIVHQQADIASIHHMDSCIVESFPFFFRNGQSVEYASDRFSVIPSNTLIHGIYTIEEVLEHSQCFFRYQVRVQDVQYILCLLRPEFWNSEYEEAFLREQTISQVLSKAPSRCVHACTLSMIPFLVYETPAGGTIKDFLLRQPIPDLAVLRRIGLQMCTAICSVHQVMMSHLGIRMDIFGVSKLGMFLRDFGVEERLKPRVYDVQRTRYYAPEQLTDGYLDARTDVYALGILLYRLYNGQFPFPDKNKDLSEWHQFGDRQQIPFLDSVHPDVQGVILKAIHPEPMLRYDSACQFKEAFCDATSKIGWFTFDRHLLPKITNRVCTRTLYCQDVIVDWNGSLEEEFGDVYPTWRLHGGELLLSVDPYVLHGYPSLDDLKSEPFVYSKCKVLHDKGHKEACIQQCEILELKQEELMLLVYVYSSIFSNPKKAEELLSIVMTNTKKFSDLLEAAVFSCWHRMDEVTTKKILNQLEYLCSTPQERLILAQSYVSLLNDEDSSARQLHLYIQLYTEKSFSEQIIALSNTTICFGQRPELVRWAIRLEENCETSHYLQLYEVWSALGVPKRAQKMKQKRLERLRLSVQQMMQKFATYTLPIPKVSTNDPDDMLSFLEEGERLVDLATRRSNLEIIISKKRIPMKVDAIPLEEEAIQQAEEYCTTFVCDNAVEDIQEDNLESDVIDEPPSQTTELLEEGIEKENRLRGGLPFPITVLWGLVLVTGIALWYSCV